MKSVVSGLRWVTWLEGISFMGLVAIAMPMKYIWHDPSLVRLLGRVHGGLVFALLVALMLCHSLAKSWTVKKSFHVLVVSLIPFAVIFYDRRLRFFVEEEQNAG